jgi:PAP2 superfamily
MIPTAPALVVAIIPNGAHMRTLALCCALPAIIAGSAAPSRAQTPAAPIVTAPAPEQPLARLPAEAHALAPADDRPSPSFGSLFRDLGRDFRHLPSGGNLLILGAAGGVSFAVRPEDRELSHDVSASTGFDHLFEGGEGIGGGAVQGGFALGAYVVGRAAGNPAMAILGADLIRAQIVDTVLTQGIKFAVDRQRPDGGSYSFPSGHTSSSFATATVLQRHFGWKVGVPAYVMASFVGGSRLQERRHYLSDVVFGAAIGIVSARAVTVGHGRATFAVSPIAAPGRAGVGFVWLGNRP